MYNGLKNRAHHSFSGEQPSFNNEDNIIHFNKTIAHKKKELKSLSSVLNSAGTDEICLYFFFFF